MKKNMSNKQALIFVAVFFVSVAGCYMCGSKKPTVVYTKNLPSGIEITGLKEVYNAMNGQQEVEFTIVNKTGKVIDYPSVEASFYKDGVLNGPATGGCVQSLQNKTNCSGKVLWLMPDSKADSIVFVYTGN